MEGKRKGGSNGDKPIAKPSYPLPAVFSRWQQSELPTRFERSGLPKERAHFYIKEISNSGSPIYGFYITEDPGDRQVGRGQQKFTSG